MTLQLKESAPSGLEWLVTYAEIVDDDTMGLDTNPTDNAVRSSPRSAMAREGVGTALGLIPEIDGGDPELQSGNLVPYTLIVCNEGSHDAIGVQQVPLLPPYSTHELGDDPPGWKCKVETGDERVKEVYTFGLGPLAAGTGGEITLDARLDEPLPSAALDLIFLTTIEDDVFNGADQKPDEILTEEVIHIGSGSHKQLTIRRILVEMVCQLVGFFTSLSGLMVQVTRGWLDWLMGLGSWRW